MNLKVFKDNKQSKENVLLRIDELEHSLLDGQEKIINCVLKPISRIVIKRGKGVVHVVKETDLH